MSTQLPPYLFSFDRSIAIEAILYLANRVHRPTILSICKLLYLADKTHLETWASFISGETYVAMKYGPVPSHSYDLMKNAAEESLYGFTVTEGYNIQVQREANQEKLSGAIIQSLDITLQNYGSRPLWDLLEKCHDAAWQAAWDQRGSQQMKVMPLESIVTTLEDSEALLEHLHEEML